MKAAPDFPLPDLTACDREPITRLETIQEFGFLLALSDQWSVVRASANLERFIDMPALRAIGLPLTDLISAAAVHEIRNRILVLRAHHGSERLYGIRIEPDGEPFDLALHYSDGLLVIEGERSGSSDAHDAALLVRTMVARLNTMTTMETFHRDCARQIRALTGFNRVMIYRFDESGAGEVIAESINGRMESFLGLHYPASDIPVQARALYLRNPFRIIADVNLVPVPLLPPASATTPTLDLSLALTRAASPVHIEYLRNMNVASSMSMSIVVEGRLWGLIACHGDVPGVTSFVRRSASELFAQMFSMILEGRMRQAEIAVESEARRRVDHMVGSVAGDQRLLDNADWLHEELSAIIPCDGAAISLRGRINSSGAVPSQDDIAAIVKELGAVPANRIFSTGRLASMLPVWADGGPRCAGMLAIPLSVVPRDYLLLFRHAQRREIRWAGDPQKAVTGGGDEQRISPRKSFEAFTVLTEGHSLPFTERDRKMAESFRSAVIEIVFRVAEDGTEERLRATERQELLIAELNHRVRNILALIRGLINQTATGDNDVTSYVQSLNGRVQALARAHDQVTRQDGGPGLLSSLFDHEIGAYVPNQLERFQVIGPPVHLQPLAFSTMALVIHELVTNSLKHGALSDSGRIEVRIDRAAGNGIRLFWRESGGPVVAVPKRRGFGSTVIEKSVPFDLHGTTELRYLPGGLEVDISIPEQFIAVDDPRASENLSASRRQSSTTAERPLDGMSVLLLEDNMIVALETEDVLRDLGASEIHSASTIAAARQVIDRQSIAFAVLDVNVGRETSFGFALQCKQMKIPFIFASGYGRDIDLGDDHRSTSIVNKPYLLEDVSKAVHETLDLRRSAA